jgi:hypothetical protein
VWSGRRRGHSRHSVGRRRIAAAVGGNDRRSVGMENWENLGTSTRGWKGRIVTAGSRCQTSAASPGRTRHRADPLRPVAEDLESWARLARQAATNS